MKLTRADLRDLRLAIGAGALLFLLGVGCVVLSDSSLEQARKQHDAAQMRRAEAKKRVEQAAEEEREIRRNLASYQHMVDQGMASAENRLDLIDSIARIKKDLRLFEIRYTIEPQRALDYAGMKAAGPLDLVASRIKLEMLLLHEDDLLSFLHALERSGQAYVSVRSCTVSREGVLAAPARAVVPRLRAECHIDLVALSSAKAS